MEYCYGILLWKIAMEDCYGILQIAMEFHSISPNVLIQNKLGQIWCFYQFVHTFIVIVQTSIIYSVYLCFECNTPNFTQFVSNADVLNMKASNAQQLQFHKCCSYVITVQCVNQSMFLKLSTKNVRANFNTC